MNKWFLTIICLFFLFGCGSYSPYHKSDTPFAFIGALVVLLCAIYAKRSANSAKDGVLTAKEALRSAEKTRMHQFIV